MAAETLFDENGAPYTGETVEAGAEANAAAVSAGATVFGAAIDLEAGVPARLIAPGGEFSGWSKVRASVYADQAGTLAIQYSRDGSTWRTSTSQASTASTLITIESLASRRYARLAWTNTAGSPTTVCELDHYLVAV